MRIRTPFFRVTLAAGLIGSLAIAAPAWANWTSSGSLFFEGYQIADGALSADASTFYAVGDDNTLKVIDVASRTVTSSVDTGLAMAREIRLSPDESQLWVVGIIEDEVVSMSTSNLSSSNSVSVFNSPWDLELTDDGDYAFVGSGVGNDDVGKGTIIDTATNTVVSTIDLGEVPDSLDVVGNDVAYIANYVGESGGKSSRRITKVDFSDPTTPTVVWNTTVENASYVQANPAGTEIWVGTRDEGDIVVLDPDGSILRTITTVDESDEIIFSSNGATAAVLKSNTNPSAIFLLDSSSGTVNQTVSIEAEYLDGFEFSRDGTKLLVADGGGYGSSDSTLLLYDFIRSAEDTAELVEIQRVAEAAIHLDADIPLSQPVGQSNVLAEGQGLARTQSFSLVLNPGSQVLASGEASAQGFFSTRASLPTLGAGTYTLTLSTQDPAGNPLVLTATFAVDSDGRFVEPTMSTPEPSAQPVDTATESEGTEPTTEPDTEPVESASGGSLETEPQALRDDSNTEALVAAQPPEQGVVPTWLVATSIAILLGLVVTGISWAVLRSRRSVI